MGIRFYCPNGHKLNVKEYQAGKAGICPHCGVKLQIPTESTRPPTKKNRHIAEQEETTVEDAEPMPASPPVEEASDDSSELGPIEVPVTSPPHEVPAAADPLAEAGEMVWYVKPASGGQFGPAVSEVMRSWLDEGRIGTDSLVWREGWQDWEQASRVFPQLGAGRPSGPAIQIALDTPAHVSAHQTHKPVRRVSRSTRSTRAMWVVLLSILVVILGIILLWVVLRAPTSTTDTASYSSRNSSSCFCLYAAVATVPHPSLPEVSL